MKNKKLLAMTAMVITASVLMSACSFGGNDKKEDTPAVAVTPTAEPTATPAPTIEPTIAPNVQSTTYTSADKSIAINLPDATWSNKSDETDMVSFESPNVGNILILHGQGEDTMASTVIPSTQDMAVSLDQADGDKVNGTDFEIQDYTSNDVNGIGVYSYTTKMLNTDKSGGDLYVVHKVFANDTEYYNIEASVKSEDALDSIKAAVASFQILGDSSLKEAAPKQAAPAADNSSADNAAADNSGAAASDNAGNTDASASTDGTTADGSSNDASQAADNGTASTDTSTNSGGFTDEQLSNTDETRTIYRNSDGHLTRIFSRTATETGVDFDGNTYSFADEQDAYDANGNSYYWHGEAADVYYMPVQ